MFNAMLCEKLVPLLLEKETVKQAVTLKKLEEIWISVGGETRETE